MIRQDQLLPTRKRPAHGVFLVEGQPTIVFLTVCTRDRRPWAATPLVHETLLSVWTEAKAWLVGRYVVMPDHIHFFAGLADQEMPLENWMRYWKSQFTRRLKIPDQRWQPDHWDTRIRNAAGYEERWEYVRQNPVRGKLVANADDWPYQGEVFELPWR